MISKPVKSGQSTVKRVFLVLPDEAPTRDQTFASILLCHVTSVDG